MNSFIGWIGGKKLLRKEIVSRFPEKVDRYIEVFGRADTRTYGCVKKDTSVTIEYLNRIQERLSRVVVENKDFENLIKVYDRPDALFYLDHHTMVPKSITRLSSLTRIMNGFI